LIEIKTSSFHTLCGQECLTPFFISTPSSKIEGVNEMIVNMQHTLKLVKESMQCAQEWAKFYVEKNQSPTTYEINDKMFLII
jgi:hypothetical protein